ncbi:MAG: S9 family peptidase [Thermoanaerobaculia bacterium]
MSRVAIAVLLAGALALPAIADVPSERYQLPPKEIAALVDAPLPPLVVVGPGGKRALVLEMPPLLTIADLSQPELKIAGLRFNPDTSDQPRARYYSAISLVDVATGARTKLSGLPDGMRARNVTWSPDGKRFAFTVSNEGMQLWSAEVATGRAARVGTFHLNSAGSGRPYQWVSDSSSFIVRLVPDRGPKPESVRIPTGPVVQETAGAKAPAQTFQDLLKNPHDVALFEYYLESQLARVSRDGSVTPLGAKALIIRSMASPDGRYLLVETLHRPFSYVVPWSRFPRTVEIRTIDGKAVRQIADLPLAENVPVNFDAVPAGPRAFDWRDDAPATLYWVEAQDEGDPRKAAEIRDRIYTLAAPFDGQPRELAALAMRYDGISWGGEDLALVHESWWKTRRTRTWRLEPAKASAKPSLLFDRSSEDRYADPGSPVMESTAWGTEVIRRGRDRNTIYLEGEGASPDGDRPFLDTLDIRSKKTSRLWRSEAPYYEFVVDVLDPAGRTIVTRRESVSEPPNYYVRDLRKKSSRALTAYPHPTPQLAKATKELIRYERADGVKLTGTLYLPPGYDAKKDGPLPVLMWAYPTEFKSADAAGQVTDSPYRFIRVTPGSPLVMLVRGWAVLDDPSIPIIGEGDREPNDTYVQQLVAGAQAAVDEVVKRGVGDRNRIAVGGHSYGAFMTANLLAHSDLFRAGIARSGAYNRTLTPFSFQAEERTFWEAPETYMAMSPFTHAAKINEPILLIHGIDDNNTGTFPIQSERLYAALKGLGGTARLVMLPHESHGYAARESVLHMLWEMDRWLEKYVAAK